MIIKSSMAQATIFDYLVLEEVLNWQLTGPRNLAQALTSLTTRNVPHSNFGPVILNRKGVPSHAMKTWRESTGTASFILNICARLVNFTPRPPYPKSYPDNLLYGFIQTPGKCRDIMRTTTASFQAPKQLTRCRDYATKWMVQGSSPGRSRMQDVYHLSRTYRFTLGSIQLFLRGLNWPRREADHSSPSSTEVKNEWSYTSNNPVYL